MKKWLLGAVALSVALAAMLAGDSVFAQEKKGKGGAKDDKVPTVKEIMKKVNSGKGLHKQLKTDLSASPVKWDDVAKKTKEYNDLAGSLGKNKPEKGEQKNWDKLTKEYADNAKALNDAADKKDADGVKAAWDKLNKSCKPCHDAHKE